MTNTKTQRKKLHSAVTEKSLQNNQTEFTETVDTDNSITDENQSVNKKIRLHIDTIKYTSKPSEQAGLIKNRLQEKTIPVEITIPELLKKVCEGFTVSPGEMKGGAKSENWVQQQLFLVDIDNERTDISLLSIDEALNICSNNNIPVACYYYSFSHSDAKPKFRLCFVMEEIITETNKRLEIQQALLNLFAQADQSCKNADRFFYGTNKCGELVNINEWASIENIIKAGTPPSSPVTKVTETVKDVKQTQKPGKTKKDSRNNELEVLIRDFDFLTYLEERNDGIKYESDNCVKFNSCEVCGHSNCLGYYKETNSFYCFGANGNKGGTIIDYLMAVEGLSVKEATEKFKYDLCGLDKDEEEKFFHPVFVEEFLRTVKFLIIKNGAKELANLYMYISDGVYKLYDNNMLGAYIKPLLPFKHRFPSVISSVVKDLFYTDKFITYGDCNPENYINFQNGLYNIDTGEIEPHTPEVYSTIQIGTEYDPQMDFSKYQGGVFDTFISHFVGGDKSQEQIIFEFIGLALSNIPAHRYKKALVIVGEGNTGKSQLLKLVESLIGSNNYYNTTLKNLEDERFTIANLFNKRICGEPDMSFVRVKEISKIKTLTGGDPITAEFKGEKAFNFIFNGILFFCANELPKFGGDKGEHVYSRFCVVRAVGKTHKKGEQSQDGSVEADPLLLDKMLKEAPYIVNKALAALNVLRKNQRFSETDKQKEEIAEYKKDNSSVIEFFDECIIPRPEEKTFDGVTRAIINKVYGQWCKDNRLYAESKTELFKCFEQKGGELGTHNGNVYYKNFTLAPVIDKLYGWNSDDDRIYKDD